MEILFLVIVILSAVLTVLLVMMQDEQGEGIDSIFGGGGGNTAFGSRSGNVLTRITTVLAIIFFASTLALALVNRTPREDATLNKALQEQKGGNSASTWFVPITKAESDQITEDKSLLLNMGNEENGTEAATTDVTAPTDETAPTGETAPGTTDTQPESNP
ncbi:MAG: preprotein translocase subunit SecG [Spirochaetales bacterium]|nr:preprotein translocase subunit SecG [Spirochaetales bacterium]